MADSHSTAAPMSPIKGSFSETNLPNLQPVDVCSINSDSASYKVYYILPKKWISWTASLKCGINSYPAAKIVKAISRLCLFWFDTKEKKRTACNLQHLCFICSFHPAYLDQSMDSTTPQAFLLGLSQESLPLLACQVILSAT